jgi:hypothetical protein
MAQLDQASLNQIVAAVLASLGQGAAPKAASQPNSFGRFDPSKKDQWLRNSFARRGFKDVVLASRNPDGSIDKSKPFNVKPYKQWVAEGKVVRRGERGVRGLFHESQTDPVPANPEMTPERRGMFRKAAKKAKLTPVS